MPGRAPSTPTGSAGPRSIPTPRTPSAQRGILSDGSVARHAGPHLAALARAPGQAGSRAAPLRPRCRLRRRGSTSRRRRRPCPRATPPGTPSRRTRPTRAAPAATRSWIPSACGFGHFDASGKYQTTDANGRPDPGATFPAIDATGAVTPFFPGDLSTTFDGALDSSGGSWPPARSCSSASRSRRCDTPSGASRPTPTPARRSRSSLPSPRAPSTCRGSSSPSCAATRFATGRSCRPGVRADESTRDRPPEVPQAGRRHGAHLPVLARAPELRGQHEQPAVPGAPLHPVRRGPAPVGRGRATSRPARCPSSTSPLAFRDTLAPLRAPERPRSSCSTASAPRRRKVSHEAGDGRALWTGLTSSGRPGDRGPSIDQTIAAQARPRAVRSTDGPPDGAEQRRLHRSRGQDAHDLRRSRASFVGSLRRLLPSRGAPSSRASRLPRGRRSPPGPTRRTFIRQKVFAQLNHELTGLQPRLCTEDRVQLQSLQAAWNELDRTDSSPPPAQRPRAPRQGSRPPGTRRPRPISRPTARLQIGHPGDGPRLRSHPRREPPVLDRDEPDHATRGSTRPRPTRTTIYSHTGPRPRSTRCGPDLYADPPAAAFSSSGVDVRPAARRDRCSGTPSRSPTWPTRLGQFSAGGKSLLAQSVICWGNELDMGAAHNHDEHAVRARRRARGRLKTNQLVQFPLKLDADPTTRAVVD